MESIIVLDTIKKFEIVSGYACKLELAGKLTDTGWDELVREMQREFKAIATPPRRAGDLREFKIMGWRFVLSSEEENDLVYIEFNRPSVSWLGIVSPLTSILGFASSLSLGGFRTLVGLSLQAFSILQYPLFLKYIHQPQLKQMRELVSRFAKRATEISKELPEFDLPETEAFTSTKENEKTASR